MPFLSYHPVRYARGGRGDDHGARTASSTPARENLKPYRNVADNDDTRVARMHDQGAKQIIICFVLLCIRYIEDNDKGNRGAINNLFFLGEMI